MSEINSKKANYSLENDLQSLEQIIADMMHDNISNIELTLAQFEKGVYLIRRSQSTLQKAQQEIEVLLKREGPQSSHSLQMQAPNIVSLENNMKDLKQIVAMIENEHNMEAELAAFKRGMQLVWQSQAMLQKAEQKVRILTENNSDIALDNFSFNEADL